MLLRMLLLAPITFALGLLAAGHPTIALGFASPALRDHADEYPGTEDFVEASRIRITSNSRDSYAQVIQLCQSALKKGLDEIDAADAKKMLATTAFQRAQLTIEEAAENGRMANNRLAQVANEAIKDLDTATEADPKYVDAYLLKGRIHVLRSEINKGLEALDQAQTALEETLKESPEDSDAKSKLSDLLVMKAVIRPDADERMKDLLKAIEVNPENERAVQQTVETMVALGRFEEAEAAVRSFLEVVPNNEYAIRRMVLILSQSEKMDEALEFLNANISRTPDSSVLYALRAAVQMAQGAGENETEVLKLAVADCNKAIELDAENIEAVLTRAKISLALKDLEQAKKDIETLQSVRPDLPDLTLLRMDIAIQEKRFGDAISDLEKLVQLNPENRMLLMQLGSFYQMDDRSKKALRVADRLVKADSTDWQALRLRGDIQLSLGKHAEAIEDYQSAIDNITTGDEDLSGVLNNLAWVLSTSPEDDVRDGKRALELGLRACELTQYAKPHILSTLAAAYAETSQFDKAIEWSKKAVELGEKEENEQLDQLKLELENYQAKKPWREKQEAKDKLRKGAADEGIDT